MFDSREKVRVCLGYSRPKLVPPPPAREGIRVGLIIARTVRLSNTGGFFTVIESRMQRILVPRGPRS